MRLYFGQLDGCIEYLVAHVHGVEGLSPGNHSQSVSCSVGIMSNCLFLVFPLSVSLTMSRLHLCCLYSSVS